MRAGSIWSCSGQEACLDRTEFLGGAWVMIQERSLRYNVDMNEIYFVSMVFLNTCLLFTPALSC